MYKGTFGGCMMAFGHHLAVSFLFLLLLLGVFRNDSQRGDEKLDVPGIEPGTFGV